MHCILLDHLPLSSDEMNGSDNTPDGLIYEKKGPLEEKNPDETDVTEDAEVKGSDGKLDSNEGATSPSKIIVTLEGNIN